MAVFAVAQIIFTIISPTIGIGQYYFFGDYSMVIFCGLAAYAIVKRRLFDVKLAIVRSVTYSLVLIALALVYLIVAYVLSAIFNNELTTPEQTISGVIISLMLAFAFQPIKRFFNKITNRIFYKDYYNSDDFFARLNSTLSITTELRSLLERVAYEIGHTLKSDQAFFFINTFDGHYVSAGTAHHKQLPKSDAARLESAYDSKNSVIIASSLKTHDPIRRLMLSHRIELLLPLVQAGEFIGHLCLGDHLNSGYTNRDLKVLDTISDELAIAIQNSLAVQEIRELNSTLQQRINNATKELRASNSMLRQLDEAKDEFVSMASHQLRTPLTSVKGYISMLIEGDAGKITDAQRHFLDEAFMSSERMVRLINDFLNVSRIQTGKFIIDKRPTDLSKVVEQEIESLRPSAISRNLEYIYKSPKDFPTVNIDEGKIRQVVMNFCDNALYYSHENTKIFVNLSIDKGEILFTVKDHGIGVPSRERTHLFSKFFRATNARKQRPDGTGVGLYLTKKIINAHDGKIVFESVEGQGSTFGFRLPLDN
jgi:signal transduction histidine kinase